GIRHIICSIICHISKAERLHREMNSKKSEKITEFCQALYKPYRHCRNFKSKLICNFICPLIDLIGRFITKIKHLIVLIRGRIEQQLLNLINRISDIAIGVMAFDIANMEVHPTNYHVKEISVRYPEPRSPDGCRTHNAPVTFRLVPPYL